MENVMLIARVLHSWTRWIFLVVAVVAIVYFALSLVQKRAWDKRANLLLNAYSNVLNLQWLFGLVLLLAWGSIVGFNQPHFWSHLTVQTLAVIVASAHHGWRRRELTDAARWQRGLIVMVVSLILVFVGVTLLPVDMQWRFFTP